LGIDLYQNLVYDRFGKEGCHVPLDVVTSYGERPKDAYE
jgi:hypothetical protein